MAETDYNPEEELSKAISESDDEDLSDFEKLIQDRFGNGEDEASGPSDAPPDGGEGEPATPPPPEPEPPSEPPPEDVWEFDGGLTLDKETARSLAEFNAFLNANPDVAEAIRESVQAKYQPQQPTQPPPEPELEHLDLDDPNVKFLYENYQKQQNDLAQAMDVIRRHELQLTTQTEATATSIVERAVTSFKQEHQLDDESMQQVRQIAGQMNIVESVFAPEDPITGVARRVDPLTAIEKALDIAYWSIPEYRDREINRQLEANRQDQEKKRKLSSLGGSSGSVPREQQTPTTKEEIHAAMIREVAQHMGTTPSV